MENHQFPSSLEFDRISESNHWSPNSDSQWNGSLIENTHWRSFVKNVCHKKRDRSIHHWWSREKANMPSRKYLWQGHMSLHLFAFSFQEKWIHVNHLGNSHFAVNMHLCNMMLTSSEVQYSRSHVYWKYINKCALIAGNKISG